MDRHATTQRARTGRRATAPKPVRRVARAARLSLEKLAEAVVDGQPSPERPRDQAALLHWLGQSVRNAHPGAPLDELTMLMADRLQEMADGGDATAKDMLEAEVRGHLLNLARISLALVGGLTAPDRPAVPKPARLDGIAASVQELTGWTSVPFDPVATIYLWLFGDEALYLMGTDMRVEAGLQMLENRDLREVRVTHPGTGEVVLVTWEEILKHADDDRRALEAAQRYAEARGQRRVVTGGG